ncbi:aminotransferase class I/II-fold pyridoxal phosphate-dependent enzyme [Ureibacillus composti]|nr:aminotransferase class I/II-fold pyridoxal phosphate-dependent enzyme [Ureibacillus composti]
MNIKDFKLEKWLNPIVDDAKYNLGSSCVKAFTVEELFEFIGADVFEFTKELQKMSLHYGHFFGFERLLIAISKMYEDVSKEMILTVHGGTGANNIVITELVEPTDNVVAIVPNYQQHYSIPESLGAEVRFLELKEENGYLPDLNELKSLVDQNTKMITLSNPNNPTGAFIEKEMLEEICKIAASVDAYVLCDEIYRGLKETYMTSIVDLYEKGIATSSTSKVFSMAGTRVGWIVTRDKETFDRLENRRSYDTICNGVFDELITAIAFEHFEKILERSREIVGESKAIFDKWIKTQSHLSCDYDQWGTTAFIKYDFDIPSDELCKDILEKASVALCYGDCFEIPNTFRLGYAFGDPKTLEEGLNVLGEYFANLKIATK